MLKGLLRLEVRLNNERSTFYRFLHFFLDRINITIPFWIFGRHYLIPIIYGMGFYNLLPTEKWLVKILKILFQLKQGAFLDVGANLGQTLLRFKTLKLDLPYVGFEPNNGAFFYLSELIRKNKFQNCTVLPVALSGQNGITHFFRRHRTDVSSTLVKTYKSFANNETRISIPAFTGDQVVKDLALKALAVIKIDVEGAELEVVRGFKNTLMQERPFVICEILPVYHLNSANLRIRKERQDELLKELRNFNYRVYRIKNGSQLWSINEIGVHGNLNHSNYLFVPAEREKEIKKAFSIIPFSSNENEE